MAAAETSPYNSSHLIMPLEEFVVHPKLSPIVNDAATWQLAGLTAKSATLEAALRLQECVASFDFLRDRLVELARARFRHILFVGLTEAPEPSVELFSRIIARQLSPNGQAVATTVEGGVSLGSYFRQCAKQQHKKDVLRREQALMGLGDIRFTSKAREELPESTLTLIGQLNAMDSVLLRHARVAFRRLQVEMSIPLLPRKDEALGIDSMCPSRAAEMMPPGFVRQRWIPVGRYLVAMCASGQLSNRIGCIHNYLAAAFILNRTLIFPSEDVRPSPHGGPYRYDLVFDVPHTRFCMGPETVMTVAEFLEAHPEHARQHGGKVHIDRLLCWNKGCNFHDQVKVDELATLSLPSLEEWADRIKPITHFDNFLRVFSDNQDTIISFGDLFGTGLLYMEPSIHRVRQDEYYGQCRLIVRPHVAVWQTARNFIREVLGSNFGALHLRRRDFHGYLYKRNMSYWHMEAAAECVLAKMLPLDVRVLFLVTDAAPGDVALFQELLKAGAGAGSERALSVVTLHPMDDRSVFWPQPLARMGLDGSDLARAMVEKAVCTMASVFVSQNRSSFSNHIKEYRQLLGVPQCHDEPLCAGRRWVEPTPRLFDALADTLPVDLNS